ncbi:MAG: hypothetical protein U0936_03430 [Planctomycetaceae bacterium]
MILLGPESMRTRRFQILISLQVALQLLIPAIAPWLHSFVECGSVGCCTPAPFLYPVTKHRGEQASSHCSAGCCHVHSNATDSTSAHSPGEQHSDQQPPHDCAHCAICQAIAAPRILTSVVEISAAPEQISPLAAPACADPLLGFGLPPQCRAPPVA